MTDTTQTGVSQQPIAPTPSTEDGFQSLFDRGAFEPEKPPVQQAPPADPAAPAAPVVEDKTAQPDPNAPKEEEAEEYQSLEEFLTKNEIDADGFRSLPVTVKIDGQTKQVPLSDVLKSYQLEGHVNNKSIELSNQQKAWETERTQAAQALQQQLQTAGTLATLARQQLLAEYQNVDWNKLRAEDPISWAVRNQEFNQKANAIDQHLAQVQNFQQQQAQQAQEAQAAALPKERDRMLEARPEWRDDTKFQAARTEISTYAQKLGYTPAELGAIFDHRYMLVLHDAARFAQLQAKSPDALKRVRAAPLMAKPGARTNRDPKQVASQQARERFERNSRDVDSGAAYFETLAN